MISPRLATLVLLTAFAVAGCATSPPVVKDGIRNIPIELWSGGEKSTVGSGTMPRVKVTSGKRGTRVISGPIRWRHPETGKSLFVYERTKSKKSGTKRQLYAINANGAGLGRVFDSRPGQEDRRFDGEVIFPLGPWERGEERAFDYVEYTDKGPVTLNATIKIRRLDFTYKGIKHSLKFDWIQRDTQGVVLFEERYVYSPGKGLVSFKNRLE
jgi:hypothetical protein